MTVVLSVEKFIVKKYAIVEKTNIMLKFDLSRFQRKKV